MFDYMFRSDGFGPLVVWILVGWIPVLVPVAYVLLRRSLPRKAYFAFVTSCITIGMPVFLMLGLEAPLLVIEPGVDMILRSRDLRSVVPFSWISDALGAVKRWWWLAMILGLPVIALTWSILVCAYLGPRWPFIVRALEARATAGRANDA